MNSNIGFAQELGEIKDWFSQHKRDPFLWLTILGPLALATITFWWVVVFPPSGAIRTIHQVMPNADISLAPRNFPSCRTKRYIFGYDFATKRTDEAPGAEIGRVCRDVINGGWVLDIDNPKFKYLESP
jgi:hypothetical protein